MRSTDEILGLWVERKKAQRALHDQMETIRAIYANEVSIDLPDLDKNSPSYVPNLLAQGLDQMAARAASVTPQPLFLAADGKRTAIRSAETKRRVVTGWWQKDSVPLKLKTRFRHLLAYSNSPTLVRWDAKRHLPMWDVRESQTCYPSTEVIPGSVVPVDALFEYKRPANWLRKSGYVLDAILPRDAPADILVTLVEYHDSDQWALVAISTGPDAAYMPHSIGRLRVVGLEDMPNPIGIPRVSVPSRIGLTNAGQFDSLVGMYYMQAQMMALDVLATKKSIYPDTYLESFQSEIARFIAGPFDGLSGDVNIVAGGKVTTQRPEPGPGAMQLIDRLERGQRLSAGIPADFGGESGTNIRTARRGDALLSAVIDFPIAEAQEVMAKSLEEENKVAVALAKHFDGTATRTLFVGTGNSARSVTFVADRLFDESDHIVSYPVVGSDINSLMIGMGQRVGMATMSKYTAASMDPWIDSPEAEHDRIIAEGLEEALVSSLQNKIASGELSPLVMAKISKLVISDKMELADAVEKVTQDALDSQQAPAPPGTPPTAEGAAAPGAQQALAGPIPGPSQGQRSLGDLLNTLRKPVRTTIPMANVAQGGA